MSEFSLVRRQGDPDANFGVYDVKDKVWLGDSEGAMYYAEQRTAMMAAGLMAVRLGIPLWQLVASANDRRPLKHKDNVDTVCTGEEAVKRIEDGQV